MVFKQIQPYSQRTISIPNILTLLRILLTPLFIILLIKRLYPQGFLVFALAGISDALDGFIARYYDQRTLLGAYLDPLADKLLLVSAFVCLGVLQVLPAWLAVIVITRDVIIVLGIAIFTITEKPYEVQPSLVSKCTTAIQLITIMVILLHHSFDLLGFALAPLYGLTAGLTICSGLHYIYLGMVILQEEV
ncbi:MAG: CDP-alcohol phosphatidyltransferase family protein [Desulfosarcinaceae bacterium]|nr:CDP-alcohol phosphatidyltransferase family protein [Desulfosarcinaceae bacterium]